jgi:hypothetical protein
MTYFSGKGRLVQRGWLATAFGLSALKKSPIERDKSKPHDGCWQLMDFF